MSESSANEIRPPLFRALGRQEPPPFVELGGVTFLRERILKHDSWAATAVYASAHGERVACKWNRTAPIAAMPMRWLGRRLARREATILELMDGSEGFPRWLGPVTMAGRPAPNAVAHLWIDGETFRPSARVGDDFFPKLSTMLAALHARDIAYVDLAKWENIIVGSNGAPHLIDFQVHYAHPRDGPFRFWLVWLQESDRYHLLKHWRRCRPDQLNAADLALGRYRPWILRVAHALGRPLRALRLLLLRMGGVRVRPGPHDAGARTRPSPPTGTGS
jgi:hypothetical protein